MLFFARSTHVSHGTGLRPLQPSVLLPAARRAQRVNKTEIENWLAIGYNLGLSLLGIRSHTATLCSSANGKSLQVLYSHL